MKMTPRERVMASVNHQNPDSLPMDLGSNVSAGISGMAYGKLKEYLGITTGHNRIYDVVQQVAQPEIQVLDIIGADVLDVGRVFNTEDSDWYDEPYQTALPHSGRAGSGRDITKMALMNTLTARAHSLPRCQTAACVLTNNTSHIKKIIRKTTRIWIKRWAKLSGVLWFTVHGIIPTKNISGKHFVRDVWY